MDNILATFRKAGRGAFSTREYSALRGKGGYARLVLHRLKKRGELRLVRNGWWSFSDAMPEDVACQISQPCYVSFHSALYMHELTTQIPRKVQLAVCRNATTYNIPGTPVKEYKVKKDQFNGFVNKEGTPIATPEKAFADSLNVPRACPQIVLRDAIESIDIEKVKPLLSKKALKRLNRLRRVINAEKRRA
ncbi:MAG: hypothetical protein Q8R15_04415 [Candidatus Micrarchaeota archaeon]|nr:hypothetical protein [Candidatus Micrarchaeota archaeon]